MIISDFDKTLTYRDTLFSFYVYVVRKIAPWRVIYLPIYMQLMVLKRVDIISNESLKKLGVFFFLKGIGIEELNQVSIGYAQRIELNDLSHTLLKKPEDLTIITASFEIYVRNVFPATVKVYGSSLELFNGKVVSLGINLYGDNKGRYLSTLYSHYAFDIFYTDSLSDESVFVYAKNVVLVN